MKYGNRDTNVESNAVVLSGNAQGTALTTSATAAQTAVLSGGLYDLWCDVDTYLKVAATANDVTTSTGYLLRVNNTITLLLPQDLERIGAIGSAGTLRYHKVS